MRNNVHSHIDFFIQVMGKRAGSLISSIEKFAAKASVRKPCRLNRLHRHHSGAPFYTYRGFRQVQEVQFDSYVYISMDGSDHRLMFLIGLGKTMIAILICYKIEVIRFLGIEDSFDCLLAGTCNRSWRKPGYKYVLYGESTLRSS